MNLHHFIQSSILKSLPSVILMLLLMCLVGDNYCQDGTSVKIDGQEWMSANLDVSSFRNGDVIPEARSEQQWQEAGRRGTPAWCYYQDDPAKGQVFGKLYNWHAVNDPRGLAPAGWHVPSAAEWQRLIDSCGGFEIAAGYLKERGTAHWQGPNAGAADKSGFSALPGGYRDDQGHFFNLGHYAAFWTASAGGRLSAWGRHMSHGDTKVYLNEMRRGFGYSIRCIKD